MPPLHEAVTLSWAQKNHSKTKELGIEGLPFLKVRDDRDGPDLQKGKLKLRCFASKDYPGWILVGILLSGIDASWLDECRQYHHASDELVHAFYHEQCPVEILLDYLTEKSDAWAMFQELWNKEEVTSGSSEEKEVGG